MFVLKFLPYAWLQTAVLYWLGSAIVGRAEAAVSRYFTGAREGIAFNLLALCTFLRLLSYVTIPTDEVKDLIWVIELVYCVIYSYVYN